MADAKRVRPLFLFSLARSGSTLVQRILAAHSRISTVAEPWLLLPLIYMDRRDGVYAEYGHRLVAQSIWDLRETLGEDALQEEIRELALRIYARLQEPGTDYFLDKTPRYCIVAREILDLFPDARFIILYRNPLSIVSSMVETFSKSRWWHHPYKIELYKGLAHLIEVEQAYGDRVCTLRFEELLEQPEEQMRRVFEYLDLDFEPAALEDFSEVKMTGRMQDQTGQKTYQTISRAPTEKWRRTMAGVVRKAWARRYLRWLGRERLAAIGFDFDELMDEVNGLPWALTRTPVDLFWQLASITYHAFDLPVMRRKFRRGREGKMYANH